MRPFLSGHGRPSSIWTGPRLLAAALLRASPPSKSNHNGRDVFVNIKNQVRKLLCLEAVWSFRLGGSLWVLFLALCAAPLALPLLLVGVVLVFTAIIIVATVLFALLLVAACGVLTGPLIFVAGLTVIHRSIPVFITCTGIGLLFTGAGTAITYGMYQLCKRFLGWSMQGLAGMIQRGGKKHA